MKAMFTVAEAAEYLNVCTKTIRRWDKLGKLRCWRTPGGHRRIMLIELERIITGKEEQTLPKVTAVYGRVSSHEQKQKGDLQRQIETTQTYCQQRGYTSYKIYQDVSSGLNTNRKSLQSLCSASERGEIERVVVTYADRLTRFGLEYLTRYFQSHGTKVEIIEQKATISAEKDLVQDLVAIITSFSGRVHGLRSHKAKKAAIAVETVLPLVASETTTPQAPLT